MTETPRKTHDLNNWLAAIKSSIDHLSELAERAPHVKSEALLPTLRDMREATERLHGAINAPAAPAAIAQPQAAGLRGRVLLVDDDEMMGRVVTRMLRGTYEIVTSTSPRAALDRFSRGDRFDVVLLDLTMPEMSGVEFYEALERISPDHARRIVFVTGGAITQRAQDFLASKVNACLDKPFDMKTLLDVLAGVSSPR